ncbi:unnamed protein product [Diatraea saccharalis]|uniref:Uncharacterized protein n=1 Tax=Diatraea saccharalis TaxID=40085 RepID=A0A9N9R5Y8_9NEOP|nr:unnamed protein product [Diatraea saccharalis]
MIIFNTKTAQRSYFIACAASTALHNTSQVKLAWGAARGARGYEAFATSFRTVLVLLFVQCGVRSNKPDIRNSDLQPTAIEKKEQQEEKALKNSVTPNLDLTEESDYVVTFSGKNIREKKLNISEGKTENYLSSNESDEKALGDYIKDSDSKTGLPKIPNIPNIPNVPNLPNVSFLKDWAKKCHTKVDSHCLKHCNGALKHVCKKHKFKSWVYSFIKSECKKGCKSKKVENKKPKATTRLNSVATVAADSELSEESSYVVTSSEKNVKENKFDTLKGKIHNYRSSDVSDEKNIEDYMNGNKEKGISENLITIASKVESDIRVRSNKNDDTEIESYDLIDLEELEDFEDKTQKRKKQNQEEETDEDDDSEYDQEFHFGANIQGSILRSMSISSIPSSTAEAYYFALLIMKSSSSSANVARINALKCLTKSSAIRSGWVADTPALFGLDCLGGRLWYIRAIFDHMRRARHKGMGVVILIQRGIDKFEL